MDSVSSNPSLDTTLGAYQIGVLVSYALFGVTTTQTYIYYSRFPDDSPKLKTLVAFVWVCEASHALCIGHALYIYTISDYGHPEDLAGAAPRSLSVGCFLDAVIAVCVQGFFSFRIYAFTKKLYMPCIIWALSFLRLVGSTVISITALWMTSMESYFVEWGWLSMFI
ncbi:hypothetical protein B0H13DRAFT_2316578 [Mycena leptocephala]|nr:hypothetical protein B0H13DRAFT_2330234 [Mycena leptocephala]KAJ7923386.1 hypothetical protein B0H13DRAFT_2316578 [Mycena leptocephala]